MRPGPRSVAKNKPFAAEERGFDLAHKLNVIVDGRLKSDDATGVHAQYFARAEVPPVNGSAGMEERQPSP